jgi:hypothetical protein
MGKHPDRVASVIDISTIGPLDVTQWQGESLGDSDNLKLLSARSYYLPYSLAHQ